MEQNVQAQKTDMTLKLIMSELRGGFLFIPRKNIYAVVNVRYFYMVVYIYQIITYMVWDPKDVHVVILSYLIGIIRRIRG